MQKCGFGFIEKKYDISAQICELDKNARLFIICICKKCAVIYNIGMRQSNQYSLLFNQK
jgi:hypothetical protein